MKMLLLVFRHSLEHDLLQLLGKLDVKAFTEAPRVFGMGEAGMAFHSFAWPGHNTMILAAMEEDQAERVVQRLKAFRDHMAHRQQGTKIPMRLFAVPCERLI